MLCLFCAFINSLVAVSSELNQCFFKSYLICSFKKTEKNISQEISISCYLSLPDSFFSLRSTSVEAENRLGGCL